MGILNGPRINFWGGIQTNVCTANNYNTGGTSQDPKLFDLATATVSSSMTDDDLIAHLRQPATQGGSHVPYYTNAAWNYYGDHQVHFVDAKVSTEGPAGSVGETGGLVGEPVYLLGSIDPVTGQGPFFGPVMVDLDPTSSMTTQIHVGGLQIGDGPTPKLLIRHDTVCSSHDVSLRLESMSDGESDAPGSSALSGTFQLAFPKSSVVQHDATDPTLKAIMNDANAVGFVLRFAMFEMAPYLTTPELVAAYVANQNPSNPNSGRVVGTLGPLYASEPETCPPGRKLVRTAPGGSPAPLVAAGYALLDTDTAMLSLDLLSVVPKAGFRSDRTKFGGTDPIGPNIDYGSISVDVGTGPNPLTFPPRHADYYKYGGIVDVPVDSGQEQYLKGNPIKLSGSKGSNSLAIEEQPLRIYGNDRNIYMTDVPQFGMALECIVSWLGGPLHEDMTFTLTTRASGAIANPEFLNYPSSPVTADAGATNISISISNNGNNEPGFEQLVITSGEASHFINFRNYLTTDFGIPHGTVPSWGQAYENVLRFYYVTFPAMSMRIPLNQEGSITATKDQFLARMSTEFFPTTLRMPITRSMSPSQTKLLEAFLNGAEWTGG